MNGLCRSVLAPRHHKTQIHIAVGRVAFSYAAAQAGRALAEGGDGVSDVIRASWEEGTSAIDAGEVLEFCEGVAENWGADGAGAVAVVVDLDEALFLGVIQQGRGFDLPEAAAGPFDLAQHRRVDGAVAAQAVADGEGADFVLMRMPGHPGQHMGPTGQFGIDGSRGDIRGQQQFGAGGKGGVGMVAEHHHQLALGIGLLQLGLQPCKLVCIQPARGHGCGVADQIGAQAVVNAVEHGVQHNHAQAVIAGIKGVVTVVADVVIIAPLVIGEIEAMADGAGEGLGKEELVDELVLLNDEMPARDQTGFVEAKATGDGAANVAVMVAKGGHPGDLHLSVRTIPLAGIAAQRLRQPRSLGQGLPAGVGAAIGPTPSGCGGFGVDDLQHRPAHLKLVSRVVDVGHGGFGIGHAQAGGSLTQAAHQLLGSAFRQVLSTGHFKGRRAVEGAVHVVDETAGFGDGPQIGNVAGGQHELDGVLRMAGIHMPDHVVQDFIAVFLLQPLRRRVGGVDDAGPVGELAIIVGDVRVRHMDEAQHELRLRREVHGGQLCVADEIIRSKGGALGEGADGRGLRRDLRA